VSSLLTLTGDTPHHGGQEMAKSSSMSQPQPPMNQFTLMVEEQNSAATLPAWSTPQSQQSAPVAHHVENAEHAKTNSESRPFFAFPKLIIS
jgi:hypothetical protein